MESRWGCWFDGRTVTMMIRMVLDPLAVLGIRWTEADCSVWWCCCSKCTERLELVDILGSPSHSVLYYTFSISECSILVYCVPATYHSHIHSPPERHVRHHHDHTNHRQTIPFQRFVDIYFPGTFIQGHCFRCNFHCVTYVTDFVFIVFGLGFWFRHWAFLERE